MEKFKYIYDNLTQLIDLGVTDLCVRLLYKMCEIIIKPPLKPANIIQYGRGKKSKKNHSKRNTLPKKTRRIKSTKKQKGGLGKKLWLMFFFLYVLFQVRILLQLNIFTFSGPILAHAYPSALEENSLIPITTNDSDLIINNNKTAIDNLLGVPKTDTQKRSFVVKSSKKFLFSITATDQPDIMELPSKILKKMKETLTRDTYGYANMIGDMFIKKHKNILMVNFVPLELDPGKDLEIIFEFLQMTLAMYGNIPDLFEGEGGVFHQEVHMVRSAVGSGSLHKDSGAHFDPKLEESYSDYIAMAMPPQRENPRIGPAIAYEDSRPTYPIPYIKNDYTQYNTKEFVEDFYENVPDPKEMSNRAIIPIPKVGEMSMTVLNQILSHASPRLDEKSKDVPIFPTDTTMLPDNYDKYINVRKANINPDTKRELVIIAADKINKETFKNKYERMHDRFNTFNKKLDSLRNKDFIYQLNPNDFYYNSDLDTYEGYGVSINGILFGMNNSNVKNTFKIISEVTELNINTPTLTASLPQSAFYPGKLYDEIQKILEYPDPDTKSIKGGRSRKI